jgi:hypothetical protein
MARFWIESYLRPPTQVVRTRTRAFTVRTDRLVAEVRIYCVEVCRFTFRFRGLGTLAAYRAYFAADHPPTQRRAGVTGPGDRDRLGDEAQSSFARLPLRLKTGANRVKVVAALDRALEEFTRPADRLVRRCSGPIPWLGTALPRRGPDAEPHATPDRC